MNMRSILPSTVSLNFGSFIRKRILMLRVVADQLTDGDPLRLKDIQFHESTTYEDFIEGFVPRPNGQGFERRDKTFRIINQRALDDPGRIHVLLIEEFTR